MARTKKITTEKISYKKVTRSPKVKSETKSVSFSERFNNSLTNLKNKALKPGKRVWQLLALAGVILLLLASGKYLIVAWVDNKPITRLEEYKILQQRYGKDVKEQLIVEKLVFSEADKRGISISDQELESEIKKIEGEQGGKDSLNKILQTQGINQDEFRKLVKLQILREKMFGSNINVTEEDVNKYMKENNQQLPETEDASASTQLKENIKEQLRQQKVNTEFSNWLQKNLQSSRVIRS